MDPLYGQKTTVTKLSQAPSEWVLIDATDKVLGRMASEIAMRLQGKNSPRYQPGVPTGESIVIINAEKIKTSGDKMNQKEYRRHTGYMGGLRTRIMKEQAELAPEKIIMDAVRGMLPKNRLSRKLLKRLKIFVGPEHNLKAQNPKKIELKYA